MQNQDAANEIIANNEVLESNRNDYNAACIIVRGDITVAGDNETQLAFKNCASFIKCVAKIDETTIADAED